MTSPGQVPAPRRARAATVVGALVVLGALGACSRGSGGPSQAQYVAVADGVCEATKTEITEISEENLEDPDPARSERWIRADLVPAYRTMVTQLTSISPPEGDGPYLSSLYADLTHEVELMYARPGDGPDRVRLNEDLRRRFASYGMKVCGRV